MWSINGVDCSKLGCKNQRNYRHKFHEYVEGWTRSIFQRITHCVSNNCSFMCLRSFLLQSSLLICNSISFNILLSVVPRSTRISGRCSKHNSWNDSSRYESSEHFGSERKSDSQRWQDNLSSKKFTSSPGIIISTSDASVEIWIQAL